MSTCTPIYERGAAPALACPQVRLDRRYWSAVLFVTAVPLCLGFFRLGEPSIWFDESATWLNASDGWRWMWVAAVSGEDCGGFVYGLVMKLWTSVFGYGETALRTPSVLFAAATSLVLLQIGRGLGNLRAGVCMAACGMLHPVVICWSRQARAYSLEVLLTAAYLAIILAYARTGGRMRAVALTIVGALLALTHVFGVFVVIGGTLFLLALRFERSAAESGLPARRSLAPSIIAGLLLGCWMFAMQSRVKQNLDSFWIDGSPAEKYLDVLRQLMPFYGAVALLVAAGAGLLLMRRRLPAERRLLMAAGLILLTVAAGPAAASALSRGDHHFIFPRYFLPGVVPVVVFAGYFLASLPRRFAVLGVLVLGAAGISTATADGVFSDSGKDGGRTRAALQFFAANFRKGDRLFITPRYEESTLRYYGVPSRIVLGVGQLGERDQLQDLLRSEPPQADARNWVMVYHCDDADDLGGLVPADCPQERFGMIRLVRVDAKSAAPAASAAE